MSKDWRHISGDWNAICDSCGRKFKASQLKRRWDGFMVCSDDFEPRQSLDFIRARADKVSVPWSRPRPADVFVQVQYYDDPVLVPPPLPTNQTALNPDGSVNAYQAGHPMNGSLMNTTAMG